MCSPHRAASPVDASTPKNSTRRSVRVGIYSHIITPDACKPKITNSRISAATLQINPASVPAVRVANRIMNTSQGRLGEFKPPFRKMDPTSERKKLKTATWAAIRIRRWRSASTTESRANRNAARFPQKPAQNPWMT